MNTTICAPIEGAKVRVMCEPIESLRVTATAQTSKMGPIVSINTMPGNAPIVIKSSGRALSDVIGTCGCHCRECFGPDGSSYCYIARLLKFRQGPTRNYSANTRLLRECPERFERECVALFNGSNSRFARWHVSGEIESIEHAALIYRVCEQCPDTRFGIYTRAIRYIETLHDAGHAIPANLTVNRSMDTAPTPDDVARAEKYGYQIFALDKRDGNTPDGASHCPACPDDGPQGVNCSQCLKCYKCKPGRVTFEYLR